MSITLWVWLQFVACAGVIGAAGFHLSRQGDAIARHTGLSGSWIGLTLVASVTSLPELATGLTSVTIAQAPNLAVGNALGSCVLNLAFLVLIDLLHRKEPVWRRANRGHVLAASGSCCWVSCCWACCWGNWRLRAGTQALLAWATWG